MLMNLLPPGAVSHVAEGFLVWAFGLAVPICALSALVYYLMSLPLRRQERARFFLDLIETGLKAGTNVEHTIV